jgi:hypothetical protein
MSLSFKRKESVFFYEDTYLLLLGLFRLIELGVGLSSLFIGLILIAQEIVNIAACYNDIVRVL